MSRLLAVAPALPPHVQPQHEITATLGPLLAPDPARRAVLERLHGASAIRTRHLALPLADYAGLDSFGQANDLFITVGPELAAQAITRALALAGIRPDEVDHLLFTTVTGVAAPSIDALLVERVGLRPDVRRLPSFGLGCAGGAAGLASVHDYLLGHPRQVAVLVCLELCSLTLQRGDDSTANLVSSAIFGDGSAAAVLVGAEHPRARAASAPSDDRTAGPQVVDSRSRLFPGTGDALGWQVGASGLRIVLSAGLPDVLQSHLADEVAALLAPHGLSTADVGAWIVHAGGPKVLDAVTAALDLPDDALAASRESLATVGNLSSVSVLHVLHTLTRDGQPAPGTVGVVMAFGPGVGCELDLLRWPTED